MNDHFFRFREKNKENPLKYVVVDCETENVNAYFNRPWQISWIVVENGQIIEEYDKFPFIHDLNVSKGAVAVTNFNYSIYHSKAEDAKGVYELLKKYLYNKDYLIIGQNYLFFDLYVIRNFERYLNICGDYDYLSRIYDTLALGRALNMGLKFPQTKEDFLFWQYKLCGNRQKGLKASVESMSKQFNLPYSFELAHDGLWDVKQTDLIFRKLYNSLEVW